MTLLLGIHTGMTLIFGPLSLSVLELTTAQQFLLGLGLSWFSLVTVTATLYLLFLKKNIALLIGIIVLKWPILILAVYWITEAIGLKALPFSLGFLPLMMSALLWSMKKRT